MATFYTRRLIRVINLELLKYLRLLKLYKIVLICDIFVLSECSGRLQAQPKCMRVIRNWKVLSITG